MKRGYKRFLTGALALMLMATMNPIGGERVFAKTAEKIQSDAQQKESYTVSFDARKGKKVKTKLTLSTGDVYGKLPKTSREGYEFKGWYTKKSGGVRITVKSVFTGTANQVLYAHWKKLAEKPDSADKDTDAAGKPGNTEVPGATPPTMTGQITNVLVPYQPNASIDYKKNNYRNFVVLKNFKAKYVYCQFDYKRFVNSGGRNVGCTATADAMLASIYTNKAFSPNDEGWIPGVGATWTNSVVAAGSKTYSVKEQCSAVYNYLQEGKPVLIRVIGHSVTAIGIRSDVDEKALTPGDILIADPADGKVKCADEMGYRVMTDSNGWGLRIPKAGLVPGK